jgi:3-hydroxy-9,10-secoandrosta-1,3,5(10)-triene-9,17-dione monooxygenase reductase component
MADEPPEFDSAHFRAVLGHFPTGVTIVTGLAADLRGPGTEARQPIGFTIGSFTSISLDPPLVGFFAMNESDTWVAMEGTGGFCVNVLRNTQAELCWRFSRVGNEDARFVGLPWRPAPVTGSPIIEGVGAWIDCVIERTVVLGDHALVVGAVRALDHHAEVHTPLVFYKGALGGFTEDG